VRDHYARMGDNELAGLEKRINATTASGVVKEKYISLLRKQFDINRGISPYFPLAHEGKFWAAAHDSDGNTVSSARFDSANDARAWRAEAEKRGFDVQNGRDLDLPSDRKRLDPKFASEIADMAKDISPEFAEDVWAHYLRSMPETGGVKRLARVGRFGYTQDALHNFKVYAQRNALTVARLEHGHELAALTDEIKSEADKVNASPDTTEKDKRYANALAQEFALRNELITNPKSAGVVASTITKVGFGWYLHFAPATAWRILMQNFTLARPMLGKHFSWFGATKELMRANGVWLKSTARGETGHFADARNFIDRLRDDGKQPGSQLGERKALEDAMHMGLISNTWAKTLASGGARAPGDIPGPISRAAAPYLKAGGWLFEQAERRNRLTTMLAAYRLGVMKGLSQDAAARLARNIVRNSHVDYSLADRPRFLQTSPTARVVGQFKLYGTTVAYRLMREFRNMTRMDDGLEPGERLQATRALAGILGRGFLFSGMTGVPLYAAVHGAVNFVMHEFEGDDSFDMTNSLKQYFKDLFGAKTSDAIMHGPASEMSGYSLGSAADYNNLFYKSDEEDKSAVGTLGDIAAQLGGSPAGIALNAAQGYDLATGPNGDIERGLEHVVPTEVANIMKAVRFYRDKGATNMRGEQVAPTSTTDSVFRALGFSPGELINQYETNTEYNNAKERIMNHKKGLEDALAKAENAGDQTEIDEVIARIEKFNAANADNKEAFITGKGLAGSLRGKARAAATAVGGVENTQGMGGLAEKYGLVEPQP
jgi:hypothetical protein